MSDLLNNMLLQTSQNKSGQPVPAIKIFDLNSKTKIQPLNPRGRMLKSHIIGSPVEYVKDLGKDIVSIKKGAQGKANDHELGKMNDLAMKAGSLGLATYLFARNPFKLKRTMEYVGFGTFFASMALWPKLAIQAPLKARTGVDIHQKYQDSYGRKKMFFQDPQYIPWDLVNKQDLNKMGDKLNVPKNIENREEVIKQTAQKLAIQGNTLWMLTAGFATPIMTALACNVAERGILNAQEKSTLDKTRKMMENPAKYAGSFRNNEGKKSLEEFLKDHSAEPLTEDMATKIAKAMNVDATLNLEDAIAKDLLADMNTTAQPINDSFVQRMFNQHSELFADSNVSLEELQAHIKSQGENLTIDEKNSAAFADNLVDFLMKKPALTNDQKNLAASIMDNISKTDGATTQLVKNGMINEKAVKDLYLINRDVFEDSGINHKSLLAQVKQLGDNFTLDGNNAHKLFAADQLVDVNKVMTIKSNVQGMVETLVKEHNLPTVKSVSEKAAKMFEKLDIMESQRKVISKFIHARVGDESETFIANQWGRVNKEFMKAIGITNKELAIFKNGGKVLEKGQSDPTDLIAKKLAELAKDKTKYESAMKKVAAAIAKYDETVSKQKFTDQVDSSVDKLINKSAIEFANPELREFRFSNISSAMVGPEISEAISKFEPATLKNFMEYYIPTSLEEIFVPVDDSIPDQLKHIMDDATKDIPQKIKEINGSNFPETTKLASVCKLDFPLSDKAKEISKFKVSDSIKLTFIFDKMDLSFPEKLKAVTDSTISDNMKLKAIFGTDLSGSFRIGMKDCTKDRILGARASFYRMIQSMDLFRRLETGEVDKPLKALSNIDFESIPFKNSLNTPNDLLKFVKGESVDFGSEALANLQSQIEKNFGSKCEVRDSFKEYESFLNALDVEDHGKADYLKQQFKELSIDDMTALIEKEMKNFTKINNSDELEKDLVGAWKKYTSQLDEWKPLRHILETLDNSPVMSENLSKVTLNKLQNILSKEIIEKGKTTLLNYGITEHTEKLNDVGPKTYKSVMELLFNSKFDSSTDEMLKYADQTTSTKSLVTNIAEYKREFIDKIANWESWYRPAHLLDEAEKTTSIDSVKRHLLNGSSPANMIKQTARNAFNTDKWIKMFGGAFVGLVGVTLISELFFGKIKKEDTYAGGKK